MKTIKKLFLGVVLCTLVFALVSCFDSKTTSIKITKLPSTSFVVQKNVEEINIPELMRLEVVDNGETTEVMLKIEKGQLVVYPTLNGISLENFKLDTVGSFTASVRYNGVTSFFDYQVIDTNSDFAGGDGSINNPYQITNAAQLMAIDNLPSTVDVYFKLMNDIDMEGVEYKAWTILDGAKKEKDVEQDEQATWYIGKFAVIKFAGTLDGNNKKIYNVTDPCNAIFGELSGATLKNLNVVVNGQEISLSFFGNSYNNRTLNLINVDLYGTVSSGYNYASYIIYPMSTDEDVVTFSEKYNYRKDWAWTYANVNIKDCDSYIDNVGTSTRVAVFVSIPVGNYRFENSFNHGYVEAVDTSIFFCNDYANRYFVGKFGPTKYTIINSGNANEGVLSSVGKKSNMILCESGSGEYKKGNVVATADSKEIVNLKSTTGNLVIPAFDINNKVELSANNRLAISELGDTSVKVKANLYFEGMSSDYGTYTRLATAETDLNEAGSTETNIFLSSITRDDKDNISKVTIKVAVKGSTGDKTEASDKLITFANNEWLVYNKTKGYYVFDSTKVMEGRTFKLGSSYRLSVLTYDSSNKAVSASIVSVSVELVK